MSTIQWTPEQQAAIETRDRSVLVSAGAGSGKTAVLAERCARIVDESTPPCDIHDILVVTFTEAAAAEMRERIGRSIRERLARRPKDRRLKRQLACLDAANISTIHAFCRRVLNRYFAQADIDPKAPILDAHEATIMRRETIKQVFDDLAARKDDLGERFLEFLAAYGNSEDQLQLTLLGLDNFLSSLPDPDGWIAATLEHAVCPSDTELPEFWLNELRRAMQQEFAAHLEAVRQEVVSIERFAAERDAAVGTGEYSELLAPFIAPLTAYAEALKEWCRSLADARDGWALDAVVSDKLAKYDFPAIPRKVPKVFNALPEPRQQAFMMAKDVLTRVRDKSFKPMQKVWSHFTTAGWATGLRAIEPHLHVTAHVLGETRNQYQSAKRELGVIDFGDLERMTLELLKDDSNGVAARLRGEIRFVLVDEYQDVNPIQAEIMRLISRESDPVRTPNLFTVGDVKQSIYRFRLAEPRLFLDRQAAFMQQADASIDSPLHSNNDSAEAEAHPPGRAIDLNRNYRSSRSVIAAINAIFEKIMAADLGGIDYDEHARLIHPDGDALSNSISPQSASDPAIELHILEKPRRGAGSIASASNNPPEGDGAADGGENANDDASDSADWEQIEREAYVIAQQIQAEHDGGRPYADMVILLRSMKARVHLFARTLNRLGIPVFADTSGGLFDALEIRDILSLLQVLDNDRNDIPLAAVLRSPLLGEPLSDTQLAQIRIQAGDDARFTPFHHAVRRAVNEGGDMDLTRLLKARFALLEDWRRRIRLRPVADVLWEIYDESGYLAHVSGLRDGAQRRANLIQLHEHARKFGDFQRQGLSRFLRYIDDLRNTDQDLEAGSVAAPSGDVVRIMTVHRSKGLEFPVVIVGELGKQFNLADSRGNILYDRRLGIALEAADLNRRIIYPTLPHRLVTQANRIEMLAEELRVLYVALTRAKEKLILVGTGQPAIFLNDAAHSPGPLTLLSRRAASSALEWVVSAMSALPREIFQPLFACTNHTVEDMHDWSLEPPPSTGEYRKLEQLANFQPIADIAEAGTVTTSTPDLTRLSRRLLTPYPAAALTRVPAAVAASALKRRWNTLADPEEPITNWSAESDASPGKNRTSADAIASHASASAFPGQFRTPDFALTEAEPSATDRGTLTHEFLQRVSLSRPCDLPDLKAQRDEMESAGVFTREAARSIDLTAIYWFFGTELGLTLRNAETRVLREWPFVIGLDPTRYDPAASAERSSDDVMLVRGIIDCLFQTSAGWQVLDYKTDRVTGQALKDRAALYAGQLQIYAAAVEASLLVRPQKSWLVFLHAQEIVEVKC